MTIPDHLPNNQALAIHDGPGFVFYNSHGTTIEPICEDDVFMSKPPVASAVLQKARSETWSSGFEWFFIHFPPVLCLFHVGYPDVALVCRKASWRFVEALCDCSAAYKRRLDQRIPKRGKKDAT